MARRVGRRALIGLLAAAPALSCGGASQPALHPVREPVAIAYQAPKPEPVPAPYVAALPSEEPERPPIDGAEQAHTDLALSDDALAARYPLYGVVFQALGQVFEKPDVNSFVIGLMRRGTTLRASEPIKTAMKGHGCDGTWHELWTRGYVCRGRGFQLGRTPQTFSPSPAPAALYDTLPYPYAKNTAKVALQYFRLPSEREQAESEASFAAMQALLDAQQPEPVPVAPVAAEDDGEGTAEPGEGLPLPPLVRTAMAPGFYVSVDGMEQAGEREFARTVRGAYVETKTLTEVTLPKAAGGPIGEGERLPLGIVYREGAKVSERDPITGQLVATSTLSRFTRVPLSSGTPVDTVGSLLTRSGQLVQGSKLRRVEPVVRPALVPKNARLIHVRLAEQTLVAYEGERPVYATLVSSGKEGFETPAGLFRVHAKHVSTTMDGLAGEQDEYSIEDVPWTLYFQGSFALHAAFWHDRFGNTRSHGCVNLSPADARWLFEWATPTLPSGFHAAMATRDNPGTYVLID